MWQVSGEAQYVDDLKVHNMLHAALVVSSRPHAKILSVDATAATQVCSCSAQQPLTACSCMSCVRCSLVPSQLVPLGLLRRAQLTPRLLPVVVTPSSSATEAWRRPGLEMYAGVCTDGDSQAACEFDIKGRCACTAAAVTAQVFA